MTSKRILELGSGVGFLGVLVATLQMQQRAASALDQRSGSLYLTDINDEVLSRCQNNIRLECSRSGIPFFRNHALIRYARLVIYPP